MCRLEKTEVKPGKFDEYIPSAKVYLEKLIDHKT